jgi:hypothetical protein
MGTRTARGGVGILAAAEQRATLRTVSRGPYRVMAAAPRGRPAAPAGLSVTTHDEGEQADAWGVDQEPDWHEDGRATRSLRLAVAILMFAVTVGIVLFVGAR